MLSYAKNEMVNISEFENSVSGFVDKISSKVIEKIAIVKDNKPKAVLISIDEYEKDPYKYSQKLYNKNGINLEGYRKTYVANATYRIVIKIENNIAKVVEVVAVGKRQNKEVYEEALLKEFKNNLP